MSWRLDNARTEPTFCLGKEAGIISNAERLIVRRECLDRLPIFGVSPTHEWGSLVLGHAVSMVSRPSRSSGPTCAEIRRHFLCASRAGAARLPLAAPHCMGAGGVGCAEPAFPIRDDQPAVIYGSVFLGQPGALFIDRNKSSVRPSECAFRVGGW